MTIEIISTIIAILVSPVIAVQVTRFNDRRHEHKSRKIFIYRTLMATRAAPLSPAHVEALNSIDLEFTSKKEKKVRRAWKALLAHFDDKEYPREQWIIKKNNLFIDLLYEMGEVLNYNFDKTHVERTIYSPIAHGTIEEDLNAIRQGLRQLLEGKLILPFHVVNFDSTDNADNNATKPLEQEK